MFELQKEKSIEDKLAILADAAKYDVACTSSGVDRKGKKGYLGNSVAAGVCHSFAADGRCISLLKILMTNHCIYDCKYCINRCSNEVERATFTPDEICTLTMEFYRRNYIEGLFLSSGIIRSPGYTMEKMCETLWLLRNKYKFNGYIHLKAIPGAPDEMLTLAGYLADRMSINLELPTKESLQRLAPNKNFNSILKPMGKLTDTIAAHRLAVGKDARMERSSGNRYLENSIFHNDKLEDSMRTRNAFLPSVGKNEQMQRPFAPAGQSTQMIIGASGESDFDLMRTTQQLYRSYDLKRVFFSAYVPINEDSSLPALGTPPPLLREHRLYQADWLMRFYGFRAGELLTEQRPNFNQVLDPKCDWAVHHLDLFPVEVLKADYFLLLRVPRIGPKSAKRIVTARKSGSLSFEDLKKVGVVLKRARYFITCGGRALGRIPSEEGEVTRSLMAAERLPKDLKEVLCGHQISLFELPGFSATG